MKLRLTPPRFPIPAGPLVALIALLAVFPAASVLAAAEDPPAPDEVAAEVERMSRIGRCGSPSFSPDGERLAVVCDLSGVPQVWTVPAAGGFPAMVTAFDDQVGGVEWSPDGEWLAFGLAPGGGMNQQVYLARPDGTGVRRVTDGGKENNWFQGWSDDGSALVLSSNRDDPGSMDAFLYELGPGALRKVYDLQGIGGLTDLSRDGRRGVLYQMASRGDDDLYLLDLESGEARLLTPHEGTATSGSAHLLPDGRTVYLATDVGRDLHALARLTLGETGEPGPLEIVRARDDADLDALLVSDDGRTAVLSWNAAGRTELEILDVATGEVTARPEPPAEIAGPAEFSADGRRLAFVVSGSTRPTDVWTYDLASRAWTRVTESPHPGVDLSSLVAPELVRFEGHDGLALSGWLYRPPGGSTGAAGGGPAPYVLSFHGGPEGQERPYFRSDYQALLARGIGVFAPNVRGSSGFGKRFVNLDNGELRFDAIRDIESAVKHLVSTGLADPGRLGIMGGSYGGYMTLAGLAWYPELFAAGANLFGMVNFATFFEHTEPWMAAISTVEYGDPETEADLLWRLSPLSRIERITDPTLVLHGANDTNVPLVEAEQVAGHLEGRGVPVKLVVLPDEGHGFRKTENRIRSTSETVAWFERYLKGDAR
ncbi:MAG TPA: S9 family peptidase [Thermoanaerobaculia bacterium]